MTPDNTVAFSGESIQQRQQVKVKLGSSLSYLREKGTPSRPSKVETSFMFFDGPKYCCSDLGTLAHKAHFFARPHRLLPRQPLGSFR